MRKLLAREAQQAVLKREIRELDGGAMGQAYPTAVKKHTKPWRPSLSLRRSGTGEAR